jgi:putative glycosyltransferase
MQMVKLIGMRLLINSLNDMKISIVTTLYNSEDFVNEFYDRIKLQLDKLTTYYEIIFVDDGSSDKSLAAAIKLIDRDKNIRVIELSRNHGHHKALMTGMQNAMGDLIFLIDIDLEEPPELLVEFYGVMIEDDCDVVYGYLDKRKGKWFEREGGRIAWWLINTMLPIRVPMNHSTVRLMKKTYTQALIQHREQNTAIGGLWVLTGFRQRGISFLKTSRGASSYSATQRIKMMFESITSFSVVPLYTIFFLGLIISGAAVMIAAYLLIRRLTGDILDGWISLILSVWLLGGIIIFSLGIIGLYIARIFIETKNRPYVIIRKIYEKI